MLWSGSMDDVNRETGGTGSGKLGEKKTGEKGGSGKKPANNGYKAKGRGPTEEDSTRRKLRIVKTAQGGKTDVLANQKKLGSRLASLESNLRCNACQNVQKGDLIEAKTTEVWDKSSPKLANYGNHEGPRGGKNLQWEGKGLTAHLGWTKKH